MLYGIMAHFDLSARAVRNLALTTNESDKNREKDKYEKGKAGAYEVLNKLEKNAYHRQGQGTLRRDEEHFINMYASMDKAVPLGYGQQK